MKEKRTFCDANHELRGLIQDIISEIETAITYENTSGLEVALSDLTKCEEIVEETQEYVEKMEDRLKQYKFAIESLGFERSKVKK